MFIMIQYQCPHQGLLQQHVGINCPQQLHAQDIKGRE